MDDLSTNTTQETGRRPADSGAGRAVATLRLVSIGLADAGVDDYREETAGMEAISDLITDLYHLAYRNGMHPDDLHRSAANHWHAETGPEDTAVYAAAGGIVED